MFRQALCPWQQGRAADCRLARGPLCVSRSGAMDGRGGHAAGNAARGEGEMEPGMLPAGPAALGIHGGAYEQLPETYAAIEKWMEPMVQVPPGTRGNRMPTTDPAQHPDPARYNEVYWPLAASN